MIERICKQCGKKFLIQPSRNHRIFCSQKCYNEYNIGVNNSFYGKSHTFESKLKISNSLVGKFCGQKNPSWKPKIKCVCKLCGKEFEILPCYQRKGRGTFCSHECYIIWAKENMSNVPLSQLHKDKISISNKGKSISQLQRDKIRNTLKGKYCGEDNPNWKGGISFEPYCPKFNNDLKNRVRSFWDYKCGECGKFQEDNGDKLSVHHVHYDKLVCCNGKIVMFIPLCKECHGKTNRHRELYERKYEHLIYDKYNGRSYFTKNEYKEIYKNK